MSPEDQQKKRNEKGREMQTGLFAPEEENTSGANALPSGISANTGLLKDSK
jgi:hypothetical protein